ncbi:HlyD family efflux transporter periplasmic adaptor subunit [Cyanobium sp. N5-Cardenillas]|uniref:HlyD family efflux transporter periplasmic adaptor subunit n=1 Tax=Cyanobium sp. N5-Cardenillas TaxID=2823720 RepID=UPI0020CE3CA6|nr:HlyD family efflux transporter periplasmic adaptor subunit [Cyanobium sp. N5-Cardenillas]MCP9785180.1 HlyD family efflux transporter periplasmic adaptor subunit [Cyanobium sp. N5-Cardenillas]
MATPPRASDPASRLVSLLDGCVNWLRSPRSSRRHPVIPVRVDLVGQDSLPAAASAPETPPPGEPSDPSVVSHPFGSGLATTGSENAQEWSFRETVVLRKSRRSSSLLVWAGVGGVAALGLWSITAPISETVAVPGKLEPTSTVKDVASPVPGVVEEVLVKEGQSVKKGQPLIRFDLREPRSKLAAAESIRERLLNENRVAKATLGEEAATTGLTANQQSQLRDRARELSSRLQSAREELAKSTTRLAGYRDSLRIYADIERRYQSLVRDGAVSEVQLLEARNRMQDLRTNVAEEEREIARLRSELVNTGSGTDVELRTAIEANLRQISDLDAQIRQARLQIQYGLLTAPADGLVFDVDVSAGSVVSVNATTPLLKVVPQDSLRAKVYLPNKAIGFVQAGQSAELSLETFPASSFGYVPATVERIGSDALTPEEQAQVLGTQAEGLHFPVILKLGRQTIPLPDKGSVPLQAGMALTADIKLRERRVISLLTGLFEDQRRNLQRLRSQ